LIDYDYIIALARTTPGVTKVGGTLTINGGTTDLQLPVTVGAFESAQWSQTAATAFAWSTSP
jgi:polyisoprenoid-binding protein YceI